MCHLDPVLSNLYFPDLSVFLFMTSYFESCCCCCFSSYFTICVSTTRARFQIPAKSRSFFHLRNVRTGSAVHSSFHSLGTGVISRGVKRPRREVNHSPPSLPMLRMSGAIRLLLLYALVVRIEATLLLLSLYFGSNTEPCFWLLVPGVSKEFTASIFRISSPLLLLSLYFIMDRIRSRVFGLLVPGVSKEFTASIFRISSPRKMY
jgi:hypothetical protein